MYICISICIYVYTYIIYLSIFIYLYTSIYQCIFYNNDTIRLPQRHILKFLEINSSVISTVLVQISEDFVNENQNCCLIVRITV